jgi:hypothetical protein
VASATKKALACAKAFLREFYTALGSTTCQLEIAGVLIFEGEKYCIDLQRKWRVDQ